MFQDVIFYWHCFAVLARPKPLGFQLLRANHGLHGENAAQNTMKNFATNVDPDKDRSMAWDRSCRAQLFVAGGGGHFEHLVAKKR